MWLLKALAGNSTESEERTDSFVLFGNSTFVAASVRQGFQQGENLQMVINDLKKELFRIADKRNFDFNLRSGWLDVNLTRTSKGKCSLGVRCAVASPALNTNR